MHWSPPNDFIPIFEKNGFIERLDYYIFEQVCGWIQSHKGEGIPPISVNLSGITLVQADLCDNLKRIMEQYEITPDQIDVELTETAFVDSSDEALSAVSQLKAMGLAISMDDFGAGISSLNRLKKIDIDTLKIDRELIIDQEENEKGASILKNILMMAKDLNVKTVAEGIETQQQLEILQSFGCDMGQGYYFSRPVSGAQLLALCKRGIFGK